jgi:Protein of unknown function DUF262/Protein of unknown function (DUF1524)/Restriction Enzyme Adenine Methylase Associated
METNVRTPQEVFGQPQRLVVPLFQRPYRWDEEKHWAPLWTDIVYLADPLAAHVSMQVQPHFLGAIVLQASNTVTGTMPARDVIDGQQRLTTLQVLLSALRMQLTAVGAASAAARLAGLTENEEHFLQHSEDRYKVWPSEPDRVAFMDVMSASEPLDYDNVREPAHNIVKAHEFFSIQAADWLRMDGTSQEIVRGEALERAVRTFLNLVVIDLSADDDPQAIFETLNARGTPLTPADLIKNLVFRRLTEGNKDLQQAHDDYWRDFETTFWMKRATRNSENTNASKFFNSYLISRVGEFVKEQQTFDGWKRHLLPADSDPTLLMQHVKDSSTIFRSLVEIPAYSELPSPLEIFAYRMQAMGVEAVRPLILRLFDPDLEPLDDETTQRCFTWLESWIVRRMLVHGSSSNYLKMMARFSKAITPENRDHADEIIARTLQDEQGPTGWWPDDDEIRACLKQRPITQHNQTRVRMILEAIEDHMRGFGHATQAKRPTEQRSPRGLTIEHLMPDRWEKHWPLGIGVEGNEDERRRHVELLGNLTLLTDKFNSSLQNGPWLGDEGKLVKISAQSTMMLNQELGRLGATGWSESNIEARTEIMTERILAIWPVPPGHKISRPIVERRGRRHYTTKLSDLFRLGFLEAGDLLEGRRSKRGKQLGQAMILNNGSMLIDTDEVFDNPSAAAEAVLGIKGGINGWEFWRHERSGNTLHQLRQAFEDGQPSSEIDTDDELPLNL